MRQTFTWIVFFLLCNPVLGQQPDSTVLTDTLFHKQTSILKDTATWVADSIHSTPQNQDSTHISAGKQKKKNKKSRKELEAYYAKRFQPRKATLYAAILPGLGQIYNKKYWKLPLVYGGFYAVGYAFDFYQDRYLSYKAQLFEVLETNENTINPGIGEEILRPAINRVRRERDFMVLLMAGVYILQMVDAHVDAHLKEFDVNPNLQVSVKPTYIQSPVLGQQTGLALTFRF